MSLGSHEPFAPRSRRPRAQHPAPVKKNPAPGFNGAGFRSARAIYVGKVHEFLCARAAFGAPWARVSGKDSVHAHAEKPPTIPETYLQFFRDHAVAFELSPCARYVAAKMPGEEHARIPPPPAEGEAGGVPRVHGLGVRERLSRLIRGVRRRLRARGQAPRAPGLGLRQPAGAQALRVRLKAGGVPLGDACRFSHAT